MQRKITVLILNGNQIIRLVGPIHQSRIISITPPVSPMGRAVFQPHRDGDIPAGHPLLLRLRHLPAGRRQGGVCVLEEMDWCQLHLALHWSHGKLQTLIRFSFITRNSAEILDLVRPGHLPQQVQRHQDWS